VTTHTHISNVYTAYQKKSVLFYFCDIFIRRHPILLLFGTKYYNIWNL